MGTHSIMLSAMGAQCTDHLLNESLGYAPCVCNPVRVAAHDGADRPPVESPSTHSP